MKFGKYQPFAFVSSMHSLSVAIFYINLYFDL